MIERIYHWNWKAHGWFYNRPCLVDEADMSSYNGSPPLLQQQRHSHYNDRGSADSECSITPLSTGNDSTNDQRLHQNGFLFTLLIVSTYLLRPPVSHHTVCSAITARNRTAVKRDG